MDTLLVLLVPVVFVVLVAIARRDAESDHGDVLTASESDSSAILVLLSIL
jgi:hypothetical protein